MVEYGTYGASQWNLQLDVISALAAAAVLWNEGQHYRQNHQATHRSPSCVHGSETVVNIPDTSAGRLSVAGKLVCNSTILVPSAMNMRFSTWSNKVPITFMPGRPRIDTSVIVSTTSTGWSSPLENSWPRLTESNHSRTARLLG